MVRSQFISMNHIVFPGIIPNWINGEQKNAISSELIKKFNPADGNILCNITSSGQPEIQEAVDAAIIAQKSWTKIPPVRRGEILHDLAMNMRRNRVEMAEIIHLETGKSKKDALGETDGAIALALFYSSEGQRLYGRTTTSGVMNKYAMTIRQPIGIAGLIVAANTPIANIAWKVFPALVCGNAAIVKAAKDAPVTAWYFGMLAHDAGLPPGVLNIIEGRGEEAGSSLVRHPDVGLISFTGSTEVGRFIAVECGKRLARVSLELGGKNPLIVCDDADLDNAVKWTLLSAFSNAGQRCAAASRIIIFERVYEKFSQSLIEKVNSLKVGTTDDDDLGPVINEGQLKRMLEVVDHAKDRGARILAGGHRLFDPHHRQGYFMAPTVIENVREEDDISKMELFGPIACLFKVKDFEEALFHANNTSYGLTASIHTKNFNRAIEFTQKIQAGVAVVNAGTYGSEPHMPFGGMKQSGNGTREPGTEALDVYSELKDVYYLINEKDF